MKITDAFLGEHGVFYPQLAELERAESGSAGATRHQAQLLAAGLASHARIEEELLFVRLDEHLDPEAGPLAVMRLEHEEVEALLARLQEVGSPEEARSLAARLVAVAREHFAKEEQILFPMAEHLLGEEELLRLGREWAARRLPA